MEDARPRAVMAATLFNDSSLRQIMIRQQAEMQSPDGSMHPFPPYVPFSRLSAHSVSPSLNTIVCSRINAHCRSNFPAGATVDWSVQWVATMYDDWCFTGDTSRIRRFWPQLVRYWNRVLQDLRPDGMWTGACLNDIRVTPGCVPGSIACSSGMVTPWVIERHVFDGYS